MFRLRLDEILAEEEEKCSLPRQVHLVEKHKVMEKRNFLAKQNYPPASIKSLPPEDSSHFMCSTTDSWRRPSKIENLSSEEIAETFKICFCCLKQLSERTE